MVADADAVNQVAFGDGMLEAMRPQAAWAQMSTIGVTATEELAARVSKERPDVSFVDAPVSGTRQPAENGQLLILASGPEQARPRSSRCSPRSAGRPSGSARPARAAGSSWS